MSTLDEAQEWSVDPNSGLFRTPPRLTQRTKKVKRAIVLYPATEQHPAQTQMVDEDILIGHYKTTNFSGALPVPEKKAMLERVQALGKAVKFAREQANSTEVEEKKVGDALLGFIFRIK